MKIKIFSNIKILIYFLISILIVINITSFYFTAKMVRKTYVYSNTKDMRSISKILMEEIQYFWKDQDMLNKKVKEKSDLTGIRITIVDTTGEVLADSYKDFRLMENHKGRKDIDEALKGEEITIERYSKTLDSKMLYFSTPMYKDGKLIGVLRLSSFSKDIDKVLFNIFRDYIFVFILTVFIIFSLFFFLNRKVTYPVNLIIKNLEKFGNGELDTKIILKEDDEFKTIGKSFNDMADSIKKLISDVEEKNRELETLLKTIEQGIFIVDSNFNIIYSNKKLESLLKEKKKILKITDIFLNYDFLNALKNSQEKTIKIESEINSRIFLINISFIREDNKYILTFFDITDLKNVDRMRKDFISNISHELKTPLTAIYGYLETIEMEYKDIKYVPIIKNHVENMNKLVEEILTLSYLETSPKIKKEEFLLTDSVKNVLKGFEEDFKKKNLKMDFSFSDEKIYFNGDKEKIERMIKNLVENSIRYTDKGYIKISLEKKDKNISLTVEDTGIGIPKKEIERIFERFYTIDKSRSKKYGGFGLGLSIVKHIVKLHDGKIEVESEEGKGTKIKLSFES
ncbi:MAG: ATP-binding protein [bacterium]|nr:ATP-binding protein [bacterium]